MTDQKKRKTGRGFFRVGDLLGRFNAQEDKYIAHEFQKYGYELARQLGDLKNKSLYIKLAKETERTHLEVARNFVKDASSVKSRPKLFMWKLAELKKKRADIQEELGKPKKR